MYVLKIISITFEMYFVNNLYNFWNVHCTYIAFHNTMFYLCIYPNILHYFWSTHLHTQLTHLRFRLVPVMPLFHIPQIPTPPPHTTTPPRHTTTPPRHTPTNKLTEKFTRLARKHLKLAGNSQEITPPARKRNISLDSHNDMSPDSISR